MKSESSPRATITLDARTEELLREIAANPNSCLLRSNRRELDEALTRTDYQGIATHVGFSSAERELLRTSRAELAYWLNVICFRRLTEDDETRHYCTRLTDGDREYIAPSNDDLREGAAAAIESAASLGVDHLGAADLLLLASSPDPQAPLPNLPSVRALAAASLRLSPTFQARHYAIQACVAKPSAWGAATRDAIQLMHVSPQRREQALANALHGTLLARGGRLDKALESYTRASKLLPTLTEFRVRALLMAVRSSKIGLACRLAKEIEQVDSHVRVLDALDGSVSPAHNQIAASVEVLDRVSATSGRSIQRLIHGMAAT